MQQGEAVFELVQDFEREVEEGVAVTRVVMVDIKVTERCEGSVYFFPSHFWLQFFRSIGLSSLAQEAFRRYLSSLMVFSIVVMFINFFHLWLLVKYTNCRCLYDAFNRKPRSVAKCRVAYHCSSSPRVAKLAYRVACRFCPLTGRLQFRLVPFGCLLRMFLWRCPVWWNILLIYCFTDLAWRFSKCHMVVFSGYTI